MNVEQIIINRNICKERHVDIESARTTTVQKPTGPHKCLSEEILDTSMTKKQRALLPSDRHCHARGTKWLWLPVMANTTLYEELKLRYHNKNAVTKESALNYKSEF